MKACRVHRFGPPDVIVLENIPRPRPGSSEVLVRVDAAGVGPWDGWIRAGTSIVKSPLPLTLGSDLAGIVEEVGPDVSHFAAGDSIFGVTNPNFIGAHAEYAVAAAAMLAPKPQRLNAIEAASVPVAAVTAWQMLFEYARIAPGQRVLINGGGGSVGAFALQMTRNQQVRVIATASADDRDYVRRLGADRVLDFRTSHFEDETGKVDVVIDTVGGDVQRRSFGVLKSGGILVSCAAEPDAKEAQRHGVRAVFFLVDVSADRLRRIAAVIDSGELITRVGPVLPLADARTAHEMLDGTRRRPRGKIVLQVAG